MKCLADVEFPEGYLFRTAREQDNESIRQLFSMIHAEYGFHVDFDNRDRDLMDVMDAYAHPRAYFGVLIHKESRTLVGTVAIKHRAYKIAELSRLYLHPEFRGQGLGRKLLEASVSISKKLGYDQLYLETHSYMKEAMQLYLRSGFRPIKPYGSIDPLYTDSTMQLSLSGAGKLLGSTSRRRRPHRRPARPSKKPTPVGGHAGG